MNRTRITLLVVASALLAALLALAALARPARAAESEFASWEDLSGKRVGMLTGAPFENAVIAKNPDVSDFSYFTATPDMLLALRTGKIDAAIVNLAVGTLAANRNPDLALFPEPLGEYDMGAAFPKGSALCGQFSEIFERYQADGTAEELWQKWVGADQDAKTILEQTWPGNAGTCLVAACATLEPSSYLGDQGIMGFDADMLLHAAEELDVRLEFVPMEFSEILASLEAGKADVGVGSILVTEERRQAVDFALEHPNNLVLITRASGADQGAATKTLDDLAGGRIALVNGSVYDAVVEERIAGASLLWFSSFADCIAAVQGGKADAACQVSPICELAAQRSNGEVAVVPEYLKESPSGYFFAKGNPLRDDFDRIIAQLEADGTLAELQDKWVRGPDEEKVLPEQDWDAPNGTLRFVTTGIAEPTSYIDSDRKACGYDVELAMLIARELGYRIDVSTLPMDSIIAQVTSGKSDFGGELTITPERQEKADFTISAFDMGIALVVKSEPTAQAGLLDGLRESFERTFVTEDRWQLILAGLGVTLLVALASGALGLGLGFLTVLARRRKSPAIDALLDAFQGIMGRLPIVVVLMVFYYIVFGKVNVPGALVAIIVFSLAFGAASGATMWNCVSAIGRGQEEASLALGFDSNETFFGVILPQAARQFIPLLQAQLVSLVKDTAVVGYIAVVDLTRASDLIRSRTMEAFFPLIATALIYAVICSLVVLAMRAIMRRLDIATRERAIKGVEL